MTAWFLVVTFATLLGLYWWLGSWGMALYTLGSLWLTGGVVYVGYLWWRYGK